MLYELQPFNQTRFDAAIAWVSKDFDTTVSQYHAVKIHALADVLHLVEFHRPIIGGTFRKLPYGPVDIDALNRAKAWDRDKTSPLELAAKVNNAFHYKKKPGPTRESMFTKAERGAIAKAAGTVFSMNFEQSQDFFHGENELGRKSALGKAWKKTEIAKAAIPWDFIIDAYAKIVDADGRALKELVLG